MRLRAGVAIDLGTVNTLVSIRGRGLAVEEPSAIAVDRGTGQAIAGGRAADALGGNAMDEAIVATVKAELGLLIGRNAARRLKMDLGLTGGTPEWAEAVGVDAARGIPRAERIPGELVTAALEHSVAAIVDAVRE